MISNSCFSREHLHSAILCSLHAHSVSFVSVKFTLAVSQMECIRVIAECSRENSYGYALAVLCTADWTYVKCGRWFFFLMFFIISR